MGRPYASACCAAGCCVALRPAACLAVLDSEEHRAGSVLEPRRGRLLGSRARSNLVSTQFDRPHGPQLAPRRLSQRYASPTRCSSACLAHLQVLHTQSPASSVDDG
ncbi:hypothetical protein DAEQUDRAFT_527464 [Daedalea quercina L-15889]|uniref:Uncharacterized protein n=1 Tax=Daedalea quercina L-15889 TaxID=1314783 RepID=A0A165M9T4_9APHY|nr:hypothetical protein DAEQUDRAFT_527464 [Daedalea quercina L-15889]